VDNMKSYNYILLHFLHYLHFGGYVIVYQCVKSAKKVQIVQKVLHKIKYESANSAMKVQAVLHYYLTDRQCIIEKVQKVQRIL